MNDLYPDNFLSLGSKGEDVVRFQKYLLSICRYDHSIPGVRVNGIFDDLTNSSVLKLQRDLGLDENGLGDVIRGQCQTVVFFRNPQANESDYATWNLTPREMNFVLGKEFVDRKYAILVSRPAIHESVILDVDLSGLGPYLKIYSSGNNNVILTEKLSKEISDTDQLVQEYLKRA